MSKDSKCIDATDITLPRPYPKELPNLDLNFWSLHVTTRPHFLQHFSLNVLYRY